MQNTVQLLGILFIACVAHGLQEGMSAGTPVFTHIISLSVLSLQVWVHRGA